ncbi:hypothetical protein T02_7385 [Trichinella nativa]|uniref:Uncharacterized protein n=1 Tax=Trichinella nativa TaxID=6335 RepID=A0A0V1LSW8_9BILA|nr:hypothetical protein T02_7385 [Trichinella nativa]
MQNCDNSIVSDTVCIRWKISRETVDVIAGPFHLGQHTVEPLQRAVQVQFDPTGSRCDRLTSIFRTPTFDKADSYGAHACQRVDRLEALGY